MNKLVQVRRIVEDYVDVEGLARKLFDAGFNVPAKKKITTGGDFLALLHSPKRIEKISDGWFRDHFLSSLYGKDFNWSPASLEKNIPWQQGEDYAKQFGMQPSDFELQTLIDRSKRNPAIIEAAKVMDIKTNDWYWSRTPLAVGSSCAWIVNFYYGDVGSNGKDISYYVRPVRSSQ